MIGKLISAEDGPKRNVEICISPTEVYSEIASPPARYNPQSIDHYEIAGLQQGAQGLVQLVLVLVDRQRIQFYSTDSTFDMVLLLDQLDGTIGERPRKILSMIPGDRTADAHFR